jgi:hypothetical protein
MCRRKVFCWLVLYLWRRKASVGFENVEIKKVILKSCRVVHCLNRFFCQQHFQFGFHVWPLTWDIKLWCFDIPKYITAGRLSNICNFWLKRSWWSRQKVIATNVRKYVHYIFFPGFSKYVTLVTFRRWTSTFKTELVPMYLHMYVHIFHGYANDFWDGKFYLVSTAPTYVCTYFSWIC